MHKRSLLWVPVLLLFAASLAVAGCRAAQPTATPVPPTPTKAPAPTVAPVAPTVAPAPTRAPAATVAPAPTAAPAPTTVLSATQRLPKEMQSLLTKYPQMKWMTDVPLPTTQPKYGGTFVKGSTSTLLNWDVRLSAGAGGSGSGVCYGGLLRGVNDKFGGNTTPIPQPDAAESWKRLDDLTWEFKLNPNVYWHDRPPVNGRKVTAEDLKFNIEKYRELSIYSGSFKIISEVTVKDPTTLVVKTSEPFAHLLALLGGTGIQFTAPEMEKEAGGIKTWCIGYGPFKLVEYQSNGGFVAERHPKYHIKGHTGLQLPYFDKVESARVSDGAAVYAAMITGKTSYTNFTSGPGEVEKFVKDCPTCPGIMHLLTGAGQHAAMRTDKPPYNDVRVRRAISMGLDRNAINATAYNGGAYLNQQVPVDAMGWDVPATLESRSKYYQFNPTEAKRLLAEAGYPNGFKGTLNIASSASGGQLVQMEMMAFQWKANIGVDIALRPLETAAHAKEYTERTYEHMSWFVTIPGTSWDFSTYATMYSKSPNNFYFINDPEVDRLATLQRTTFDPAKQREAYQKLFQLGEENVYRLEAMLPFIYTFTQPNIENVMPTFYAYVFSFASRSLESGWFK
ncbi:MAG: ABC transporter substrate-binding protein [Chloroflexi bacterium]|nr:ABC transporter substrate-binding protein [Chloroflexota bacterium]